MLSLFVLIFKIKTTDWTGVEDQTRLIKQVHGTYPAPSQNAIHAGPLKVGRKFNIGT